MKLSDTFSRIYSADFLLWIFPLTLIAPNVILGFTEQTAILSKIDNIVLPLGIYVLLVSLSGKVGRTVVCCLPITFFAAFQIVLLYLYGESIIAVDMFLNVVTTNMSEATELLGNLAVAILTVMIVYVAPLVIGIIAWCRGARASHGSLSVMRRCGVIATGVGAALLGVCYLSLPSFNILRDIFPVNVIHNMFTAISRTEATAAYYDTSADFDFHAVSGRDPEVPEIYVLIIGETSRADNWQLFGYDRPTTPRLCARTDVIGFSKVLSESNTTHKSVPLLISPVTAASFNDSIYSTKSIVEAFNSAGYHTAWLSNQARNHSFIEFFAREADRVIYLGDDGAHHYDHELLAHLRAELDHDPCKKKFILLHTYGSHFNYNDRYPADHHYFNPDRSTWASEENRAELINAYDNTIRYTDALIDSVISIVDSYGCPAAMMYTSDHGEDIFDDARRRFLHASPVPTFNQLHVPLLLWMSEELRALVPGMFSQARTRAESDISSSESIFDTMLSIAGIDTPYADRTKALTDTDYAFGGRFYVNDYNEGVPLKSAGLRIFDYERMQEKNISAE